MTKPAILCLSGLDPSGGAGLQADLEAIGILGCYGLPIVTCLTVQNTQGVNEFQPVSANIVERQIDCLLDDLKPDMIKVGLLGSVEIFRPLLSLLSRLPDTPVVVDPILKAGGNQRDLASETIQHHLMKDLLPRALLLLPNLGEAQKLSRQREITAIAASFAQAGSQNLLITDIHPNQDKVIHQLFRREEQIAQFEYQRLPHQYHGSGCTLTSSACAFLAKGQPIEIAVANALDFTWQSLYHGMQIGKGQWLPNRFFAQTPSTS
jgi:hydroxymethylpyrimidine/phosphomethylpyrimidine kinase